MVERSRLLAADARGQQQGVAGVWLALLDLGTPMTTILHVEDDPLLAELVQLAFASFGFRGDTLIAETVSEAREMFADLTKYPSFELVLTDMHLPDGTGLDVVRTMRSNPSRAHIPVLILSGDIDRARVDRAYALGANSYVTKGAGARSMREVLKALYDHWLRDALLPANGSGSRTHDVLTAGVCLRMREADLWAQVSATESNDPAQASFWMSMALKQGNTANLLTFLDHQLRGRELDDDTLDDMTSIQGKEEPMIAQLERDIEAHPELTAKIARRGLLELLTEFDIEEFVRLSSQLFPIVPTSAVALRDLVTCGLERVVAWLEHDASDRSVDQAITRLRGMVSTLREGDEMRAEHASA